MKVEVLTLIQPWASLIAYEEKMIETRSWGTKHRGDLAIHAGKKIDYEACEQPRIKLALAKHGITKPSQLPTGCIVGICKVFDCVKMAADPGSKLGVKVPGYKLSDREYSFGNYAPGRYAWILANVRRPARPIPAKGQLGIWKYDLNYSRFHGQEWA